MCTSLVVDALLLLLSVAECGRWLLPPSAAVDEARGRCCDAAADDADDTAGARRPRGRMTPMEIPKREFQNMYFNLY